MGRTSVISKVRIAIMESRCGNNEFSLSIIRVLLFKKKSAIIIVIFGIKVLDEQLSPITKQLSQGIKLKTYRFSICVADVYL